MRMYCRHEEFVQERGAQLARNDFTEEERAQPQRRTFRMDDFYRRQWHRSSQVQVTSLNW